MTSLTRTQLISALTNYKAAGYVVINLKCPNALLQMNYEDIQSQIEKDATEIQKEEGNPLTYEGLDIERQTRHTLTVHSILVSQVENGYPQSCHAPAKTDLIWADAWRSQPFMPWYIAHLDNIGQLLVAN